MCVLKQRDSEVLALISVALDHCKSSGFCLLNRISVALELWRICKSPVMCVWVLIVQTVYYYIRHLNLDVLGLFVCTFFLQ